jgi:type I restriction enzyme S subunit
MPVRNYDLTDALVPLLDAEKEPGYAGDIGSMKKVLKDGDVVISRLRAYLKEVAVVRTGDDILSIGSSEFIVLRPKDKAISPETLIVFLRSAPVQTILKWCQDGSQHPRFSESDLLSIAVPDAVAKVSEQITKIVKDGFTARHRARKLLEAAKRAVEIAIEIGEPAAISYLDHAEEAI